MAEIILKVGTVSPDPRHYQDGDVVQAFSRRRIRTAHAEMICHPVKTGFTAEGLRPGDTLGEVWQARVCQYRFQRVSWLEALRTDRVTGEVDAVGLRPDRDGRTIHIPQYMQHLRGHPRHRIFGTIGRERWYGGVEDRSHAAMDAVWRAIEARTTLRERDHLQWPFSLRELSAFLVLPVEDFDDALGLDASLRLGEELIRKRRHNVFYAHLVDGTTLRRIWDDRVPVDLRGTTDPVPLSLFMTMSLVAA